MLSVVNKAIIVDKCLLKELDNNVLLCSDQIGWVLKYDRKKLSWRESELFVKVVLRSRLFPETLYGTIGEAEFNLKCKT